MTVVASREGKEIGRDSARFIVYEDDRELENPAADRALLRQASEEIAEATGGESLTPEQLPKYPAIRSAASSRPEEHSSLTEKKIWDNWPFLPCSSSLS